MVQCLSTQSGSFDENAQIIDHLVLAIEVLKGQGTQGVLKVTFALTELLLIPYVKIFHSYSDQMDELLYQILILH